VELIKEYFTELDRVWKPAPVKQIPLRVIGSAALLLQAGSLRGTKDSDILETADITPVIGDALLALAGKGSDLSKKYRLYIDIVKSAIPFLPLQPVFNPVPALEDLKHFQVTALDVTDVAVSKLKRFSSNDISDIRFLAEKGLVKHVRLVQRFLSAIDAYSTDARAEDFPEYVANLHTVERDFFEVNETEVELPGWLG
jgi:hypothetical protein